MNEDTAYECGGAVGRIAQALADVRPGDRRRVIGAALTLLGDDVASNDVLGLGTLSIDLPIAESSPGVDICRATQVVDGKGVSCTLAINHRGAHESDSGLTFERGYRDGVLVARPAKTPDAKGRTLRFEVDPEAVVRDGNVVICEAEAAFGDEQIRCRLPAGHKGEHAAFERTWGTGDPPPLVVEDVPGLGVKSRADGAVRLCAIKGCAADQVDVDKEHGVGLCVEHYDEVSAGRGLTNEAKP